VIAGATKVDQVAANAAAAQWQPSDADLSALRTVLTDHPV
jgi:aryl-alcohol dehydrogenase-like predicted oxidoreductase